MSGLGSQSPNQREGLSAVSSISGNNEYVYSTNHSLDVVATISGTPNINIASIGGNVVTTTIPVSGTVSVSGVSTAANQTNGSQLTQIVDAGGDAVTVTGGKLDVNATVTGGTGSSAIDKSVFVAGTDSGTPTMGFYQSSLDTVVSGDVAVLGMTPKRGLFVNLQTSAGVETGIAAAPLQVSLANTGANATAVKVDGTGGTFPISATNLSTNIAQINGATTQTGHGTASGALRVELPTDGTGVIGAVTSITNALPVGTNSIGKISDITTSVVPGTAATNLGKAEDAGHTTGDTGVMMLAVRNDSGVALATSDLDYIPPSTDNLGTLRVGLTGTVSTNNSSTATLTANSVFTGTSDDALNYNEVRITIFADVVSATDGLSIQQSSDNTNWDVTDTYTIAASTGKTYSVPRQARYIRVVYTNGPAAQGAFRLQMILNRSGARVSSQRPNDAYTNETDLEQQQSFLMNFNGTTWDRARGTTLGSYNIIRDASGNSRGANVNQYGQLSVSVDNQNASTNINAIGGVQIATTGPGIAIQSLADDLGMVIGTTNPLAVSLPQGGFMNADNRGIAPKTYVNTAVTNSVSPVSNSKTNLYGYHIYNSNSTVAFVQFFNTIVGGVTLGTTQPLPVLAVPAGGWADAPSAGTPITSFTSGLSIAATTTATGSSALTTGLLVNLFIA